MRNEDVIKMIKLTEESLSEEPLKKAVQQFFYYLNRTEESDGGIEFHPVTINCCRVMWMKGLEETLIKMAELSGSELKKNEH